MQRMYQNIINFLQQPGRCVQAVQFEGDQPWHFSDGKYGLCHHVYWLPADARVVLNHCDVEQDGQQQDFLSPRHSLPEFP